ncbi:MAG: DUF2283 domain-containing protein [Patescibacteria group bacterium]
MKINYDKVADAIYFTVKKGTVSKTLVINEHLTIDVNKNGETLGIELLDASSQQGSELEKNIRNGIPIKITTKTPLTV